MQRDGGRGAPLLEHWQCAAKAAVVSVVDTPILGQRCDLSKWLAYSLLLSLRSGYGAHATYSPPFKKTGVLNCTVKGQGDSFETQQSEDVQIAGGGRVLGGF